jgi:hypothetical protein
LRPKILMTSGSLDHLITCDIRSTIDFPPCCSLPNREGCVHKIHHQSHARTRGDCRIAGRALKSLFHVADERGCQQRMSHIEQNLPTKGTAFFRAVSVDTCVHTKESRYIYLLPATARPVDKSTEGDVLFERKLNKFTSLGRHRLESNQLYPVQTSYLITVRIAGLTDLILDSFLPFIPIRWLPTLTSNSPCLSTPLTPSKRSDQRNYRTTSDLPRPS